MEKRIIMKNCKESECRCKNEFMQECFCKKCEEAERAAWERLSMESLWKIWDNPKDEAAAKWYEEQFTKGAYDKFNKKDK